MLRLFFVLRDFAVFGGLGSLKPKKNGEPQISVEITLAKTLVLGKKCPHIFHILSRICFGDQLKQL